MKGIEFGNYHSYDDFHLILNSKKIEAPTPKTESIDIPGGDGKLDFTEFFGEVKFTNRKLTFEFSCIMPPSLFLTIFSEVQQAIHGKKLRITLDDDEDFYYVGRVTVSAWKTEKSIGKITVEADCEPYKYRQNVTVVAKAITDSGTISLTNSKKSVVPRISTTGPVTLAWTGGSASLSTGNDKIIEDLVLREGTTTITVTGTASVMFKYQEGEL
jgi:phage-related protein